MRMEMLVPGTLAILAASLGVSSHLGYFIRGEHHMHSLRLFILLLTGPVILFVVILGIDETGSLTAVVRETATVVVSYLGSLTASILIYRVFFHPLRNYPGPISAKLTKLSHVLRLSRKSDNYLQVDRLHKVYGDIVR